MSNMTYMKMQSGGYLWEQGQDIHSTVFTECPTGGSSHTHREQESHFVHKSKRNFTKEASGSTHNISTEESDSASREKIVLAWASTQGDGENRAWSPEDALPKIPSATVNQQPGPGALGSKGSTCKNAGGVGSPCSG